MELEAFKKSIQKSDTHLQKHGVKLYDTLMNGDDKMFEDTIYSFVGIAAIQVCHVRFLRLMCSEHLKKIIPINTLDYSIEWSI